MSSVPDFHFHQLIHVAFMYVIHVVHDGIVGEAKITKIFAVYLQASGFSSQLSEHCFEGGRNQLGLYCISLSYSSLGVDLVAFFV